MIISTQRYGIRISTSKNARRSENSVYVGWNEIGILPSSDPSGKIETRGLATCYALYGCDRNSNLILGHLSRVIAKQDALEYAKILVEEENREANKGINFNAFEFRFLEGPYSARMTKTLKIFYPGYYDLFYGRQGLKIKKRYGVL